MTNLEKIRRACIAANPEIMELKFGCHIKHNNSNSIGYFVFTGYNPTDIPMQYNFGNNILFPLNNKNGYKRASVLIAYQPNWKAAQDEEVEGEAWGLNEKHFKILGRDIHLADILLTIEKYQAPSFVCRPRPSGWARIHEWNEFDKGCEWDLRIDNLEYQSSETLAFIASLLSNETEKR